MAEARNLKAREYNTDVLSHPDHNVVNYNAKTRYTNTMRSNAFHNEPDHVAARKLENKRNNTFADKPLATKVARASYQDSNIFGTKDVSRGTTQASAITPTKGANQRNTNTFRSEAFAYGGAAQPKGRDQRTFQSSIFGSSVQEKSGRTKLGGESKGTSTLFGDAQADYVRSSDNKMIAKPTKVARPERPVQDAASAKAREVYGKSADIYGFSKNKRDGGLMSSGADWKNCYQAQTNQASPMKQVNQDKGVASRDRKYQNLQSSVFGGGYAEGAPVEYDRDARKNAFGSNADWKTEAGMAKPLNGGSSNVDTFRQRQKQLASSVFDQTDHSQHAPITKKAIDVDNVGHKSKSTAKGRKTDAEFKQRVKGFEPVRANYEGYNARSQKQSNLSSAMDRTRPHTAAPKNTAAQQESAPTFTIQGRETKATKQAMLASNDFNTGTSSLHTYNMVQEPAASRVVDLQLQNLPSSADLIGIKKMSGARHVISAAVDEDNMKGTCTGTGRIQIRLNQKENLEDIQLNFAKQGVQVKEFAADPRKRPNMTGPPKDSVREITNTKVQKQAMLQTTDGGIFGATGDYRVQQ